jgi:hypothetical protein
MLDKPHIGILAYGSLLADPGTEIAEAKVAEIDTTTPFSVEYARSSGGRDEAPTLVPVPVAVGQPVQAKIFMMDTDLSEQEIKNRLYRRELGPNADPNAIYDHAKQQNNDNAVKIKVLEGHNGVPIVFYTFLNANISEVLCANLDPEQKANKLATLAVNSVTAKTYQKGRDGIQYLADAIDHGIQTPLTELYRVTILRAAGDAPDLKAARRKIAQDKGLQLNN